MWECPFPSVGTESTKNGEEWCSAKLFCGACVYSGEPGCMRGISRDKPIKLKKIDITKCLVCKFRFVCWTNTFGDSWERLNTTANGQLMEVFNEL